MMGRCGTVMIKTDNLSIGHMLKITFAEDTDLI